MSTTLVPYRAADPLTLDSAFRVSVPIFAFRRRGELCDGAVEIPPADWLRSHLGRYDAYVCPRRSSASGEIRIQPGDQVDLARKIRREKNEHAYAWRTKCGDPTPSTNSSAAAQQPASTLHAAPRRACSGIGGWKGRASNQ